MSRAAYSKRTCWFCKKEVSIGGLGYTQHMRKHVREGVAEERVLKDPLGIVYYRAFERVKKDKL